MCQFLFNSDSSQRHRKYNPTRVTACNLLKVRYIRAKKDLGRVLCFKYLSVPAFVVVQQKCVNAPKMPQCVSIPKFVYILMWTGPLCVFSESTLNCTGTKSIPNLPFCEFALELHLIVIRADLTERFVLQHQFLNTYILFDFMFQFNAPFVYYIYQLPLHVSSHIVLIIRRIHCIHTASGSLYVTLLRWPFSAQAVRGVL